MFLNKRSTSLKTQSGSAIVIAIFVIIIISLLGAALMSLQRDSAKGTSYEVYAARAYLSAYSASEVALMTLFPLGSSTAVDTNCREVTSPATTLPKIPVTLNNDVGFHGCTAHYTCQIFPSEADIDTRYKIQSTATCETGNQINTRRQITVEATAL